MFILNIFYQVLHVEIAKTMSLIAPCLTHSRNSINEKKQLLIILVIVIIFSYTPFFALCMMWCTGELDWFKELGWAVGRSVTQIQVSLFLDKHSSPLTTLPPTVPFQSHNLHGRLVTLPLYPRGLAHHQCSSLPFTYQWMETCSLCWLFS